MTSTIPDALALDLRDLYLSAQPTGLSLPADSVRLKHAVEEPPSPRLVILSGNPRPQPRMDGTASVPVTLEYITDMDAVSPEQHSAAAGKLDTWWRSIRAAKRRNVISTRTYLHELSTTQPTTAFREEEREQVTAIRGQLMISLVAI